MSRRYQQQTHFSGATRFTRAPMAEVEFSRMTNDPTKLIPLNGGDLVPILCFETLPHATYELDFGHITRLLSAALRPTMGSLIMDVFAFEVPNRVVNQSWRNVQGENSSDYWSAPQIELAPLYKMPTGVSTYNVQIPIGSIADYYGFPTQKPMDATVLSECHDLKFKGYLSVWNEYFRSTPYQPPIPFSTLNIYQGFLEPKGTAVNVTFNPDNEQGFIQQGAESSGNYSSGALVKAIFGEGFTTGTGSVDPVGVINLPKKITSFSALDKPLKANKLHDPFTSLLPSPQRGPEVSFSVSGELPVQFSLSDTLTQFGDVTNSSSSPSSGLTFKFKNSLSPDGSFALYATNDEFSAGISNDAGLIDRASSVGGSSRGDRVTGWNVEGTADLTNATGISINDLRMAIATQQVYETLARGGSRYWEFLKSFFGVETDNPFPDIPTQIGHYRTELDMFQVAQTSASQEGGTPQGSLTAYGYTAKSGAILRKTTIEYGYIHVFAVIRHRNLYSTYFAPDNMRRRTLDFYMPQFANIGEQPVRKAVLNPFEPDSMEKALGYQEFGWEYRYTPDEVCGELRSGIPGSLDVWHYGDYADSLFEVVDGQWLISNTQEVLDRTLSITSELAPQFICAFTYKLKKQLPMPVYSVPGLDTI